MPDPRGPQSGRVAYPGFDWLVSPTDGWPDADGAYAWVAYGPPSEGIAERRAGFADGEAEATYLALRTRDDLAMRPPHNMDPEDPWTMT